MIAESAQKKRNETEFVPTCGRGLMLWASRHYVRSVISRQSLPETVVYTFRNPLRRRLLNSVEQVWDILIHSTTEDFVVHEPNCSFLSLHEKLIMMELECLQGSDATHFGTSVAAVLPDAAKRIIEPEIKSLARLINIVDQANEFRAVLNSRAESTYFTPPQEHQRLH